MVRERRIRAGEGDVRVQVGGRGPAMVLLHGFASGVEGWPSLELSEVRKRRTVAALDLPGHGGSDPVGPSGIDRRRAVDVVLEVCGELFEEDPVDWVGYSMGSRLVLTALAEGVPMRRALLESPNPGLDEESARRARAEWDEAWARRFEAGQRGEALEAWLDQPIFASRGALASDVAEAQRAVRAEADAASLSAWLRGFGTGSMPAAWAALATTPVPVHVLVGERDTRYVEIARRIERLRPDTPVTVVGGAGHAPHIEAPAAWRRWLLSATAGA